MSAKSTTAGISMLLCLAWSEAQSDESPPTDLDLRVAYCAGATEAGLQLPMIKSTAALGDLLIKRKQHFDSYLQYRGYQNGKDMPPSLAPAVAQGKADLQLSEAASAQCVDECQMGTLSADPKLTTKKIEDILTCGKACMVRSTNGRSEKLRICEDVEKFLPF